MWNETTLFKGFTFWIDKFTLVIYIYRSVFIYIVDENLVKCWFNGPIYFILFLDQQGAAFTKPSADADGF